MADLEHLRSFLAMYRAGSVTKAARVVHLTQPALSAQLRALEADLGRRLFARRARGLEPTDAAHSLAASIAPHVDALAAFAEEARVGSQQLAGLVTLGGPAELLGKRVVAMLAGLVDRGLRLRLVFGLPAPLVDQLAAGDLDLAIATVRVARAGIDYQRFYDEALILVAGRAWAAKLPPRITDAHQLADAPLIAYADDLPLIRRYYRAVLGVRPTTRPAVIAPDLRAVMHAVAAGAGVSVLPRYLCADFVARGDLVDLAPQRSASNTLYLATRAVRQPPRVALVAEMLRRAALAW